MSSCGSRERITRWRSPLDRSSKRPGAQRRFARECGGSTRRATRTPRPSSSPAATRSRSSRGGRRREPVARHDAVVVESHQGDHLPDVALVVDPARGHGVLPREDRMVDDASLLSQGRADLLAEAEVGGMIAVEMADLVAVDAEAPLASLAVARLDSGPGG